MEVRQSLVYALRRHQYRDDGGRCENIFVLVRKDKKRIKLMTEIIIAHSYKHRNKKNKQRKAKKQLDIKSII